MEEVIREGRWTCPGCGNSNRGRDVKCQGCGQARENVEFEYDEGAAEVTGAELSVAAGGADWVCGYCSTSNRAAAAKCQQCGAAGSEGQRRSAFELPRPGTPPETPADSTSRSPAGGRAKWIFRAVAAGGVACVALFIWLVVLSMMTHEEKLTVVSARWTRQIQVEHLIPVDESAWDLPAGGRLKSSREEVHHHDKVAAGTRQVERVFTERVQSGSRRVKTGTRNLGNGYFKDVYRTVPEYRTVERRRMETETVYRDVPVYRRRYYYEIDRWKPARSVDTSGADCSPVWGDSKLSGPREREGPRAESYAVVLQGAGKELEWTPAPQEFARLKLGGSYQLEVNGLGRVGKLLE